MIFFRVLDVFSVVIQHDGLNMECGAVDVAPVLASFKTTRPLSWAAKHGWFGVQFLGSYGSKLDKPKTEFWATGQLTMNLKSDSRNEAKMVPQYPWWILDTLRKSSNFELVNALFLPLIAKG